MNEIIIDGNSLTIEDVIMVARNGYKVKISEEAEKKVVKARNLVDKFVKEGRVEYGITTGFGKFADVVISKENTKQLQKNLIMSHACGVGDELPHEVVRAAMLLRANALAKGYSGIRLSTLKTLIDMLNKDVCPVIYEKGSLGASGDLAPLAHMVLTMLGEGEAYYNGKRMPSIDAMKAAKIDTVELVEKEGLALINGTPIMTAIASLAVYDAVNLSKAADITGSMTVEALRGITDAYYYRVNEVRPQVGQMACAKNLLRILKGSSLTTKQGELRVQDAYTLRCIPQIHGASKDAINYAKNVVEIEINSATDNPLIFEDEEKVISGGNFHGQPIALAMDFLGIAVAELADVSERRIERLVNYQLNDLPPFLTKEGGLNSGFMITQYVAASLVSENKVLAHPASVDSIPSSANQEDHVSMGTIAARKCRDIIYNVTRVLGIEYLADSQALYFRGNVKLGEGTEKAYELIRSEIKPFDEDRIMYPEINKASDLVSSGKLVKVVEDKIGELNN
ncbi:MAG TPA: histidine ammonia-lyase [Clostridiaceae bacterium]|jgi:histidine ammonia-lyase|nr:histidine ammonia-lyase [Clostridiaceae bacterium]HBF76490.1 histidine ammonia-lyase [Clostridiaceae bacterium]HBG38407.1 histidine ammonia-lyase [Clostridiaceae bacterium]HBN27503.1 histidine ammonia-lyase [Clostridiaceae bacterium]HBX48113.1 histidine ammonia-lyase [Clostridiaceae bacterium]